jgi:Icc-related predicted phosphoesterase
MKGLKSHILLLLGILMLASCKDIFDYSPYVIDFDEDNKNVNQTNADLLQQRDASDTIRIAFTGDTHRFSDELNDFVYAVNRINREMPFDFVVHVGDIADFGLPKQYLWGNAYLLNLECPYFVLLGNHDMVGNGGTAYQEMFGPYNFSFIYGDIKFVFLNTNSREFKFNGQVPDLNWLSNELKPNSNFRKAVVFFHVPPTDMDFDSTLRVDFYKTMAKYDNVLLAVHGHVHCHDLYFSEEDSITYLNVYGVEFRKFDAITISNDNIQIETHTF